MLRRLTVIKVQLDHGPLSFLASCTLEILAGKDSCNMVVTVILGADYAIWLSLAVQRFMSLTAAPSA